MPVGSIEMARMAPLALKWLNFISREPLIVQTRLTAHFNQKTHFTINGLYKLKLLDQQIWLKWTFLASKWLNITSREWLIIET